MSGALRWEVEGRDRPLRQHSRFVAAAGLRWHVQQFGDGPPLLLLHGTGASAHSWRDVMPLLADRFTLIAPDLPGHGFTGGRLRGGPTLPNMAAAVAGLVDALGLAPRLVVGHSAGAAIALELARTSRGPLPVIGFNPALMPFPRLAQKLFPAMAKMLFVNPFVPRVFARMARVPGETGRFLERSTGSRIDRTGLRCYEVLLGNSRHCEGALAMMANWDLEALAALLPAIESPVRLVHSRGDNAVPLGSVEAAARRLPECSLEVLPALGHLAHEEDPAQAAALIARMAQGPDVTMEEGVAR